MTTKHDNRPSPDPFAHGPDAPPATTPAEPGPAPAPDPLDTGPAPPNQRRTLRRQIRQAALGIARGINHRANEMAASRYLGRKSNGEFIREAMNMSQALLTLARTLDNGAAPSRRRKLTRRADKPAPAPSPLPHSQAPSNTQRDAKNLPQPDSNQPPATPSASGSGTVREQFEMGSETVRDSHAANYQPPPLPPGFVDDIEDEYDDELTRTIRESFGLPPLPPGHNHDKP